MATPHPDARAAAQAGKPLVVVHEADPFKGDASLDELCADCPDDLRDAVLCRGEGAPVVRAAC